MLSWWCSVAVGRGCSALRVCCCDATNNVSFHLVRDVIGLPCLETAQSTRRVGVAAESRVLIP